MSPSRTSTEDSRQNDADKKTLFAGSKIDDSRERKGSAASGGMSATMSTLNEVGQNLEERGERLRNLDDKTKKLADASNEFANLAKQLKEQQRGSWW
jgi:hypothetical protein